MPYPTLLKMTTLGGACILGKKDVLRTVGEGKKANMIPLNIDQSHLTLTQSLINIIVEAANEHDVTDSIINGRIVMKNRGVLTLDEERIRHEVQIHMEEVVKRAY